MKVQHETPTNKKLTCTLQKQWSNLFKVKENRAQKALSAFITSIIEMWFKKDCQFLFAFENATKRQHLKIGSLTGWVGDVSSAFEAPNVQVIKHSHLKTDWMACKSVLHT